MIGAPIVLSKTIGIIEGSLELMPQARLAWASGKEL